MKNVSNGVRTAFFTVLFVFLFLYIFTKSFGPIPFSVNSVNTTKTDMFTVSGNGEATAVPDTALTNFGVTKTASTVTQAKNEVNQSANKIIQGLKNLGIQEKKIKTTDYSISPNYDYTSGRNTVIGYVVTQNLQVEITPIEKANQAVDMATKNGANMVGNIQFTVNDEKRTELENKAREDAISKAKAKAQSIASASGINLGRLVNVQENNMSQRPPVMYDLKTAAGGAESQPATQLQPGENTVSVSVTLSYETF
jgi:uncharacterized protein